MPPSTALLYLREISRSQGERACLRKDSYLGEHPVRFPDPPATPFCRVGTSITKSCYWVAGGGGITFTGACDESQAKW